MSAKKPLRSQAWSGRQDKMGFYYRSFLKNSGAPQDQFDGRPVIGICNTWSELNPCNALVSDVVPHESLLARAREIADTIANHAPIAAEAAKLNLKAAHTMPAGKAIEYERDPQTICFATDAREGRAAFRERQPVFRRR
jgi:dihydroxyacid dehydratase/phosphogluconate dehydratase